MKRFRVTLLAAIAGQVFIVVAGLLAASFKLGARTRAAKLGG